MEHPFNPNSDENLKMMKYASMMRPTLKNHIRGSYRLINLGVLGQEPFEMHSAADAVEKLATGIFDQPLVDVKWFQS